jgi:hypothetical protein
MSLTHYYSHHLNITHSLLLTSLWISLTLYYSHHPEYHSFISTHITQNICYKFSESWISLNTTHINPSITHFAWLTLSCSLTYILAEPRKTSGVIRVRPGTTRVRDDPGNPAFDPGWNKIFNITGVVRGDLGSIALPASSLALPGTTGVTPEKHCSSAGTNRGWSEVWYSR